MLGQIVEDRYRIEEELGSGAMGRVYRARHVRLGNCVAVKVLHKELLEIPQIVARFEREARTAARLHHRNLVGVLDVGHAPDGRHVMILELAPGRRLTELVSAPLPRDGVIDLTRQLLRGLHHAHTAGLIHRDLKPDNILVELTPHGDHVARIVDFGIAVLRDRDAADRLTDANMIVGTPHYMSPEHATGRAIDHRSDLFALGVIVYEMLAGCLPFSGSGAEVALANVTQDPPPIAARAPFADADPVLEAFARKLMARRLGDRFQSAAEALAMLDLIDRDRIAGVRALCGFPVETPAARAPTAPSLPRESDTLPTQLMTAELLRVHRRPVWPLWAASALAAIAAVFGWS